MERWCLCTNLNTHNEWTREFVFGVLNQSRSNAMTFRLGVNENNSKLHNGFGHGIRLTEYDVPETISLDSPGYLVA